MTINNTFAYAMQVRHAKQIAEQKRTTKNLQMQSANLNQRTSTTPTGLFGANLNDTINKNIGRSFKAMQNRKGLEKALNDPEESVRHSAVVALSNLEFMKTLCKNEKFGKLTGG